MPATLLPILDAPDGATLERGDGSHTARATCPYCGVGCVVDVRTGGDGRLRSVHADPAAAPNFGMLCPKGAFLFKSDAPHRRLTVPMVRDQKGGPLRATTWADALDRIADGLRDALIEHGPDAVAWYGSGQLDTEASYVFTKLFKGYLGCNHTDTNSRLCMSSAVAGYLHSFGSDGPSGCYDDIEEADTFFILGANMTANHPVLFNRVRRRRATDGGCRLIVVDPRRSKTAEYADLHLPVRPGGDVALLRLLAKRIVELDAADHMFINEHTEGYAAFAELLRDLDEPAMLDACGVSRDAIDRAARWMSRGRRVLSFYCMGANQSTRGTDKNTAIIDLHLLRGDVGQSGCGPFSLTGQPNAMGGREVGYLSHQLPGYRFVADAEHRREVEELWGLKPGSIATEPGRAAVAMFDDAARGEIDVLWIACTNPAVSMPDLAVAQHALRRVPLVVVQDCYGDMETAAYADVLLPAATWGEKTGTMTNSERLVTRSRPALSPPGEARPDWSIAAAVARAMRLPGFDFASAEEVWDEFRLLTAGTACDVWGMTHERLERGGLRWPCPETDHPGTPRRYNDGRFPTPTGRARFSTAAYHPPAEATDPEHPLVATTGRVAAQWHTRARTGNVPELVRQAPEPVVEVHADDAAAAGVIDGGVGRLVSRRGWAVARVRVVPGAQRGVVFVPFHWGEAFHPHTAANHLTHRAVDVVSKQPDLKHAAVRLEPAPESAAGELARAAGGQAEGSVGVQR